jgi:DNA-binding MarR family transcriptional regulator
MTDKKSLDYSMFDVMLLQSKATRNLQVAVNQRLETYELTLMEWLFLGVVQTGGGGGLSMTAIATGLDVTMPQITALSRDLLKRRLVRQKTQNRDKRSRHLIITARGKQLLEKIKTLADLLLDTVANEVGDDNVRAYITALEELGYLDKPHVS